MRAIFVLMAILALSGCATVPRSDAIKADEKVDPAKVRLLHIPVRANGLVGTLIVPDTTQAYPGVLRLGGAEGGVRTSDAESIASEGYAVFALAYFGVEGLPADLEEIPLEYFGKAIAWMQSSPRVDSKHLGIVGISRGSTLALLLPTIYDDFDAVVALAPSHAVWQSVYLDWGRYAVRSSLSYRGKALPFVPYDFSNEVATAECNAETSECAKMYDHSLNQQERLKESLIPVERIGAPVLLISGKADTMWPSSKMSDLVVQRLAQAKHPYEYRHIAYDGAGHCGINGCFGGGTPDGNQLAREDLRRQLMKFLARYLTPEQDADSNQTVP